MPIATAGQSSTSTPANSVRVKFTPDARTLWRTLTPTQVTRATQVLRLVVHAPFDPPVVGELPTLGPVREVSGRDIHLAYVLSSDADGRLLLVVLVRVFDWEMPDGGLMYGVKPKKSRT